MKKQLKKIRISRETILRLEKESLEAAGGSPPSDTCSHCGSCMVACTTIRTSCC